MWRVRCSHMLCLAQYVAAVTDDASKVNPVLSQVGHARGSLQRVNAHLHVVFVDTCTCRQPRVPLLGAAIVAARPPQ